MASVPHDEHAADTALISACLLGVRCRYDGRGAPRQLPPAVVAALGARLAPVCPEQLGGLPTPRASLEIVGGDGHAVVQGRARVITASGQDRTAALLRGSEEVLHLAQRLGIRRFVGQQRSPSCSCSGTYDGTFQSRLVEGTLGVCAALLAEHAIEIVDPDELDLRHNTGSP